MSREERIVKQLSSIADVDLSTFRAVSEDLMDLYERGSVKIALAGPRLEAHIPDIDEKILKEKHNVGDEKLREIGASFFFCIHYILAEEVDDMLKKLIDKKDAVTADNFKRKIEFVQSLLEKHPSLKKTYQTYTFSKLKIFDDIQWEADLKVFQSPAEHAKAPYPVFPVAKIRLVLRTPDLTPEESRTLSFEFEIAPKDLDLLLHSLQNLREALINLEKKKLID